MHSEVYTVLLTMMEQGSYTQVTARNAIGKVYGYQLITDAVTGMSYQKDKYYRDPTNGEVYLCTVDVSYAGLPHEAVNVYFNWSRKE